MQALTQESNASTSLPPRSSSVQALENVRDYRPSTTENPEVPAEETRIPAEDTEILPDPSPVHESQDAEALHTLDGSQPSTHASQPSAHRSQHTDAAQTSGESQDSDCSSD
jgi:hypothetical protein